MIKCQGKTAYRRSDLNGINCNNNPVAYVDSLGLDTYYGSRELGGDKATDKTIAHSFTILTDIDPKTGQEIVTDTMSWGNQGKDKWFKNSPEDMKAAEEAIKTGVGAEKQGGEKLDKFVKKAYDKVKNDTDKFNTITNNCKQKSKKLIKQAKKLQKKIQ